MTVAQMILSQLGGNRFILMTGSKDFVGSENSLTFSFPKKNKLNRMKIVLNEWDTYDIEFGLYSPSKFEYEVRVIQKDLYAEALAPMFEKYTGMYTSI
jgi:hypothetical protein